MPHGRGETAEIGLKQSMQVWEPAQVVWVPSREELPQQKMGFPNHLHPSFTLQCACGEKPSNVEPTESSI